MHWKPRGWTLIGMLLLAVPGAMTVMKAGAMAQAASPSPIATAQVTDTVYRADGTPAMGTVIVSWSAFTTALGQSVPSGTTSAAIGVGGALSVPLVPNAGSTPMGTYYTAVYHLDDGTVSREFWVVPASQSAVTVSSIKSTVVPTSVAMQTVSKSYVDTAIATAITGHPLDGTSPYVMKSGDNMTGPLALPGDPTTTNQAADKHYVDVSVAGVASGLGQKVSALPAGSQAVAQPAGTQLQVNRLNGEEYASQYLSGLGGNGIANAIASPDCASGCDVKVDRSYGANESYHPAAWNSGSGGTHVQDNRNGQQRDNYLNPTSSLHNGEDAGQVVDVTSTRSSAAEFAAGGSGDPSSYGLLIKHEALTGGNNLFPATIENVPYFKSNYDALNITGTYNTMGQHAVTAQAINCYGVGDCLIGSQFITSSGGVRDEADEGAHPYDLQIQEDTKVLQGTCSAGCTAGSTVVKVAVTGGVGTEGEGRYLIDKNPANEITSGVLTGGSGQVGGGPGPSATFSGTNFPVSVFLATAATIPSQANNVAPGNVTVAIATSGVTTGFATSTAAVPSQNGVACVADQPYSTNPHNYEMANYSVVDATHLQMTLNKVHRAGSTIAFGGLCGYGLEQTVDTVGPIRQVFPVIGSYSPSALYYGGSITSIVGVQGNTSSFLNVSLQVASIARSNGVVTVTTAGNLPVDVNGLTMTVSGVADQSYNGSFAVASTGTNTLTYAQAGANSTSTGGTVAKLTGGYVLYPMAEVLGVFDTATQSVDGQMTLAPNTVAWAANDPLEEPHYYQQAIAADVEDVGQTTPRPTIAQTAGVQYQFNVGPGLSGWTVSNAAPVTNYLGNGGTHAAPHAAYQEQGVWQYAMETQAGEESVFRVHCNSHGCGKWNSGYNLFELDGNTNEDRIFYQPLTSTLAFTVGGAQFQFGGAGFSAATINAGTVNATRLNGAVSAAQLPLFGSSGSSHGPGAVPDPGATAGTARYLREDGTWAVPAGSGASGQTVGAPLSSTVRPVAGAMADYDFLQGTGTTLADISGNSNNGTLGAGGLAPNWTATGLSFSGQQQVALPASLNGAKTFFAGVYLAPLNTGYPGGNQENDYPMLVGSSLGAAGLNLLYDHATNPYLEANQGAFSPTVYASGRLQTSALNLVSGFHVLTYVLGTSSPAVDHLYIDGTEVAYNTHTVTGAPQTSGSLFLGSSDTDIFTSSGLVGTMYRFAAFSSGTLTAAQIMQISNQITSDVAGRGVPVAPMASPKGSPTLNCIGDSITAGYPSNTPFCSLLSLNNQPSYSIVNWGIVGVTAQAVAGSESNRVAPTCANTAGPSNALIFLGTNDLLLQNQTPASVLASINSEVQTLKMAGCHVFLGTMLSRTGNTSAGTSFDAAKDVYDGLILTNAKMLGADGLVDFAANPLLGADGANSNRTYFGADGVHPTQAGQQFLANAASNALNYYYGYSEVNPHVVTSLPYSMAAGDGEVSLSGLTDAGMLTLPDCTGQSGAVYRINNPQSGFAVTVVPLNGSELINGLALGTGVPVPANGTLMLRDVPNAKTVSGCHWEM